MDLKAERDSDVEINISIWSTVVYITALDGREHRTTGCLRLPKSTRRREAPSTSQTSTTSRDSSPASSIGPQTRRTSKTLSPGESFVGRGGCDPLASSHADIFVVFLREIHRQTQSEMIGSPAVTGTFKMPPLSLPPSPSPSPVKPSRWRGDRNVRWDEGIVDRFGRESQ
jgi:hypothetical protein